MFKDELNVNLSRRRFCGWLSAAGAGCFCLFDKAHAGYFYSTKPVSGIPQSWVNQKGLDVLRYANHIKKLRLKNITPRMVLQPHFRTRGRTYNSLPPRSKWNNISATLKSIDKISSRMNKPVKEILSAYRSPSYNRAVRGRSRSQHLQNTAVDLRFAGCSSWSVSRTARKMRDQGLFRGGVGHYSSFTHIDTRGHNVNW